MKKSALAFRLTPSSWVGHFFSELLFFGFFFFTASKTLLYPSWNFKKNQNNAILHLKPLDQLTYSRHTLCHAWLVTLNTRANQFVTELRQF